MEGPQIGATFFFSFFFWRLVQHPIKWLDNPNSSLLWPSYVANASAFLRNKGTVEERIPVWVRLCLSRWLRWINLMSHMEQAYGFTPTHTEQYISPTTHKSNKHNFQPNYALSMHSVLYFSDITPKCLDTTTTQLRPLDKLWIDFS